MAITDQTHWCNLCHEHRTKCELCDGDVRQRVVPVPQNILDRWHEEEQAREASRTKRSYSRTNR